MRDPFDAIVIGGGPAGALAGLLLARHGWRIAIIERGPRKRNKTCGQCLSPRALPILEQAGLLDAVRTVKVGHTNQFRVHTPGRAAIELALHAEDNGLLVDRRTFDQLILDRAAECGATVMQGARSRVGIAHRGAREGSRDYRVMSAQAGIQRECRGRTTLDHRVPSVRRATLWIPACAGMTRTRSPREVREVAVSNGGRCPPYAAPLILGADGLGSGVARAFGVAPVRAGRKFGFSFDLDGASCDGSGAIDMFVAPGGYLGVVEQRDGSRHIAGLIGSHDGSLPREPVAFCHAMAKRFTELQIIGLHRIARKDLCNFVAAGPMPWRPRAVAGKHFALLGDAAGYVEPFTGEGMCWAIQSAHALAEVAAEARPGRWSARLASNYRGLWQERIGRAQRRCARITWALERPWAVAAVRRVASRATLQRVARRVVAA